MIEGVFFIDGPIWKDQRRFALRHLRDFGFGRRFNELECDINEDLVNLINLIKDGPKYEHERVFHQNGNVLCSNIFYGTAGNAFLKIILNQNLTRKDMEPLYK